jgi:hypothetical protein
MKNLFLLSTDNPSRLWVNNLLQGKLELSLDYLVGSNTAQHIYITNDEDPEEDNWILKEDIGVAKYTGHGSMDWWSKIILTTDPDLIADGVQAIDDDFLAWFVKNPTCEEVEVKLALFSPMGREVDPSDLTQNHSSCVWKYVIKYLTEFEIGKVIAVKLNELKKNDLCEDLLPEFTLSKSIFDKLADLPKQETISFPIFDKEISESISNEGQKLILEAKYNFANEHEKENDSAYEYGRDMYSFEMGAKWQAERIKKLIEKWEEDQIRYEELAVKHIDNQHNLAKFKYKAMATRDCWKELLKLLND